VSQFSNKIKSFTEYLDVYDAAFEWTSQEPVTHRNKDIAFAQSAIGAATITLLPTKYLEMSFLSKYVSKQYLDNTQDEGRKLKAFYTQDARIVYTIQRKLFKEWKIIAQANNVFDRKYEPNGYTYPYVFDGNVTADNYYYPMAGRNYMVGVNIKL
jgi:iron complex outermembrane receptor protein